MRLLLPLVLIAALTASESDIVPFDGRAMLGVNMTPPSSSTQAANGTNPDTGVEAQTIYPGTAAERMGIQPGDLITTINGGQISSMNDLRNEIALTGVGGQATLEILRGGQKITLTDSLKEWPKNIPYQPIDEAAERRFRDWQGRRLDRTQQAVTSLSKQVEDIERSQRKPARAGGPVSPLEAMAMPASDAFAAMPAFRLRLHESFDAVDSGTVPVGRVVAWDARILIGSKPVEIF